MAKRKSNLLNNNLSDLVEKFSKNDVIAEMEKEYASLGAKNIPISQIDDNGFVKKVKIPKQKVDKITQGIKTRGLFNPLVIRPSGNHYELILGRKRYYGAKKAKYVEVPCVIQEATDEETLLMIVADTRDQRDGDVVQMALLYDELTRMFGYSQATLADLSHSSRSQVTNILRLLNLPWTVLEEISLGTLSYGHGKAIASLSDEEIRIVVNEIHNKNLSVRETEYLANQIKCKGDYTVEEINKLNEFKKDNGVSIAAIDKDSVFLKFNSPDDKQKFMENIEQLRKKSLL